MITHFYGAKSPKPELKFVRKENIMFNLENLTAEEKVELYNKISDRNFGIYTRAEQEKIKNGKIIIIGQGCVGELATVVAVRIGVGNITIVDKDNLEWSNFNRNPFARSRYVGKPKVDNIVDVIKDSSPLVNICGVKQMLTEENAKEILAGHDIVLCLVDNMAARVIVHRAAYEMGLPCITMSGAPKYRALVSTFITGGIDYETGFGIPTAGMKLDEAARKIIAGLKKERAEYSAKLGADQEWAKLYISGEREFWAVTPMRTFPTAAFAAQEAINFLVYGEDGIIAKAPDARIYDLEGKVFSDLGIVQSPDVKITEAIVKNVLKLDNKIYRRF